MTTISKRSAASRKAWRVRKRMKEARKIKAFADKKNPHQMTVQYPTELWHQLEAFRRSTGRRLFDPVRTKDVLPNPFLEIGKS